jgi:hypothetical protein
MNVKDASYLVRCEKFASRYARAKLFWVGLLAHGSRGLRRDGLMWLYPHLLGVSGAPSGYMSG